MTKKWELISSKLVFKSRWLSVEDRAYKLPDGKIIKNYYHLNRPNYVLIIGKDEKEKIVVLKQYRRGVDDFVYELPAGWVDKGETPVESALRELKEETGLSGKGKLIGNLYPQPGFGSMKAFVVFIELDSPRASRGLFEKDENIDVIKLKLPEIKRLIKKGVIKDMGFLSAIALYEDME